MTSLRLWLALYLLSTGLCLELPAQIAVDHWTTNSGLPLNSVLALCQSPEGYLWITSLDGLVRFDGVQFTTFDHGNTPGIEGNRFAEILCGPGGSFWALTEGSGLTRYDQGRFQTYTSRDGLSTNSPIGISQGLNGEIWVLAGGVVHKWDNSNRRFHVLDPKSFHYSSSIHAPGRGIFYRIDGDGLSTFDRGKQMVYPLPADWTASQTLAAIDGNDELWLSCTGKGLAHWDHGHWSLEKPATNTFTINLRGSQGSVWRVEHGWDSNSTAKESILLPPGTLPGRIAFRSLFEDREGNLWLATDGDGLYRLRTQSIRVESKEQGLPDRNVYAVYQSRDGSIWAGTWTGGLCRIQNGRYTSFGTASGLPSDRVFALGEDSSGTLWAAFETGLYRFHNGRFEIPAGMLRLQSQPIRAIHFDSADAMWLGTGDGLFRYQHGQWTTFTRKDGLAADDTRVILPSRGGGLWIGAYGGLSLMRDGKIRAWTSQDGMAGNSIRSLYEDASNTLWIGTYDSGLSRFADGRFTVYNSKNGLFNNGVFQILEDSRDNLWMSSNRGIYRVSKRELNALAAGRMQSIRSIDYGRSDGMRNIECNGGIWPAGIRSRDGRLWFPTQDGLAVIDPEHLPVSPAPPPVAIESCLIDRQSASLNQPLFLKPGYENLEIQYTALSLVHSEHIRFRYKLDGLDRDWVDVGTRRTAYYSHLPPGSYTFQVAAAHGDGVWSPSAASLVLTVLPPFYRTWWFLLLMGAVLASSVRLGWIRRIHQLERERRAQQAFAGQLIASQEADRKRIAAELHDSLGQHLVIIKNRALLLLRERAGTVPLSPSHAEQVEEISSEASEAVREVREISYDLRPYRLDRLGLTAALRAMIETASTSTSTKFTTSIEEIDGLFESHEAINFYRIVQECVNNVLKHAQASEATVQLRRMPGRLRLTVRDDGRGFAIGPAKGPLFEGFGLNSISERAHLLGGKLSFQSGAGQGTVITIDLERGD